MSIGKIVTDNITQSTGSLYKTKQSAARLLAEFASTPACLEGLNTLGSYNRGFVKKCVVKNAAKLSCEEFERLLDKRSVIIPYKELSEIQSIFIGNRFGESSNEIINNYLRTGEVPTDHKYWNKETIEKIVKKIRECSKKLSLDKDYAVYRGVKNLDFLPGAGETFIEKGFMSTTASKNVAERYCQHGSIIEVILPEGTNVNLNPDDLEILLNNNSRFKVLSKSGLSAKLLLLND